MPATAVYNLGSLNIDRVVRVPRIVAAGETIAGGRYEVFAGGKGANQSVALARAGAPVKHVGRAGEDGRWLVERLAAEGIDTRHVRVGTTPTGQALIQVDPAGENAIVVVAGANAEIKPADVDAALSEAAAGDWLLVQNETSGVAHALREAKRRGMLVAFNPAPCDQQVEDYPLECVDLLCLNESEAAMLGGAADAETAALTLRERLPQAELLLTRGEAGAWHLSAAGRVHQPARSVPAIDTTAAGDTFLGYFLAARLTGAEPHRCLELAAHAAALCVSRSAPWTRYPGRRNSRSGESRRYRSKQRSRDPIGFFTGRSLSGRVALGYDGTLLPAFGQSILSTCLRFCHGVL